MSKNICKKTFNEDGIFVVPAGCTKVKVVAKTLLEQAGVMPNPGEQFQLFIKTHEGQLYAAGGNSKGFLGDNSVTPKSSPVLVLGGKTWKKIISPFPNDGGSIYGIDTSGKLWAWGGNVDGQIGNGSVTAQSTPVLIVGTTASKFKKVYPISMNGFSEEPQSVHALDGEGNVWAWGSQEATNALGIGADFATIHAKSTPTLIAGGHKFKKLFFNANSLGNFLCVHGLKSDATLYSWGSNVNGFSGTNQPGTMLSSPTLVAGATEFSNVFETNGTEVIWALDTDGNIWTLGGDGSTGLLGDGSEDVLSSPVMVLGGKKFNALSAAKYYLGAASSVAAFIDNKGDAYTWGENASGILGAGLDPATDTGVSSPVLVLGGLKWKELFVTGATPNLSIVGVTKTGEIYAWGDAAKGYLAQGNNIDKSSPVLVAVPGKCKKLTYQADTFFALNEDGEIYSWGLGEFGVLGDGSTVPKSSPVLVVGGNAWADIFSDRGNALPCVYAITQGGSVYAWGSNINGNLGDGTSASKSSPVLVLGGLDVDASRPQTITEIDVVPGQSVPVLVQGLSQFFGDEEVGFLSESLTIEFQA